jgi:hypothetical protein
VSGSKHEGSQNEHVERALQQSNPVGRFPVHILGRCSTIKSGRYGRRSTIEFGLLFLVESSCEAKDDVGAPKPAFS